MYECVYVGVCAGGQCACACVYTCVCVGGGGFDHLLAADAKARGALGHSISSAVAAASRKNVQRRYYFIHLLFILFYFRHDLCE